LRATIPAQLVARLRLTMTPILPDAPLGARQRTPRRRVVNRARRKASWWP